MLSTPACIGRCPSILIWWGFSSFRSFIPVFRCRFTIASMVSLPGHGVRFREGSENEEIMTMDAGAERYRNILYEREIHGLKFDDRGIFATENYAQFGDETEIAEFI